MKYRKKPDDFIVEEIANHKVLNKGDYKLYSLEKIGIETFALFESISRLQNIPRSDFGIAGIKDAFAKTTQYVTLPKKYEVKNTDNAKFKFLGYVNNPLKLGDLRGNKFVITVRKIKEDEIDKILENSKSVMFGLPNYFDSQRFGSVVDNKFIGKLLVKKDYEEAVKLYLTSFAISDDNITDSDKEKIFASWGVFNVKIDSYDFKKIINAYKETKKWIVAYKHIPPNLRQLFISSYQSYLWNECIKLLLKERLMQKDLYSIPYVVDNLTFNKVEIENLPRTFQTISHKMELDDYEKEIIDKVLAKEDVKLEEFNIRQTGNFFKSTMREIMLYPQNFEIGKPVKDGNSFNMTVKFALPKGCYATMVLKKIFEQ